MRHAHNPLYTRGPRAKSALMKIATASAGELRKEAIEALCNDCVRFRGEHVTTLALSRLAEKASLLLSALTQSKCGFRGAATEAAQRRMSEFLSESNKHFVF